MAAAARRLLSRRATTSPFFSASALLRRGGGSPAVPESLLRPAAAIGFPRGYKDYGGEGENVDEFEKRVFGSSGGSDNNNLFGKLDGYEKPRGGFNNWGSMGGFRDRGNSSSVLEELGAGFNSLDDGMDDRLDEASRTFHMTEEVEDEDYDFRPDVTFRRGSTYNVRDLDLTRPAAAKNPTRPQFQTTTEEVLKKADFRNIRFLSNFLTEAGIIIKRSQTRISAKAQRKVAREIKTARALGLLPFTTMGQRPFIPGRSVEVNLSEEEYGYDFVDQKEGKPDENENVDDVVPGVETA
uniref:Small ribosomal subunit protein bS18c n=1 Tax=Leersia perrieri TaxID=77586 RepID=A0A0D9WSR8_9ORYZ